MRPARTRRAGQTWVGGETAEGLALAQSQYQATYSAKNLTQSTSEAQQARAAALKWLLAESDK